MTDKTLCPFCNPQPENLWIEVEHGRVIRDGFPISNGHTLIVPKAHIPRFHNLDPEIQAALWKLVAEVRHRIAEELQPDGFNIGLNDGEAAGQTVMHAHVHVIPRWKGDEQVEKAKGQVWVNDAVFLHLGPKWRELLVA